MDLALYTQPRYPWVDKLMLDSDDHYTLDDLMIQDDCDNPV